MTTQLSKKSAGKTCWLGLGSLRDRDRGPREPDRDLGARYRRIGRRGGHRGKNNNNIYESRQNQRMKEAVEVG